MAAGKVRLTVPVSGKTAPGQADTVALRLMQKLGVQPPASGPKIGFSDEQRRLQDEATAEFFGLKKGGPPLIVSRKKKE